MRFEGFSRVKEAKQLSSMEKKKNDENSKNIPNLWIGPNFCLRVTRAEILRGEQEPGPERLCTPGGGVWTLPGH